MLLYDDHYYYYYLQLTQGNKYLNTVFLVTSSFTMINDVDLQRVVIVVMVMRCYC